MDAKVLEILVYVIEMFQDMKLWRFKEEGISGQNIFGHSLGWNFEFEVMI